MSASALLQNNPHPSEHEIRHALEGNLCRCTGYENIVKAVQYAAAQSNGHGLSQSNGATQTHAAGTMHEETKPESPETPAELEHQCRCREGAPRRGSSDHWCRDCQGAESVTLCVGCWWRAKQCQYPTCLSCGCSSLRGRGCGDGGGRRSLHSPRCTGARRS